MALREEEIVDVINDLVEIYKPYDDRGELKKGGKTRRDTEYPEFYEGYNDLVNDYLDVQVHTERVHFPERLFKEKSPNMTEAEESYLKANFKNITQPIFMDFISSVGRAFNDGNWKLTFKEDEDFSDGLEDYVEKEIRLTEYVRDIILPTKLRDPNGVVCIKPDYEVMEIEGETVISDRSLIEPKPYYYSVMDVWAYESKYVVVHSDEKSVVEYGGKDQKMGHVFEVYDNENIWIVRQSGKYVDWTFDYEVYYQHGLDLIPAKRLKGVPYLIKNKVHYQTPFLFAVDNLDLALINENNKQVSIQLTMFPIRVMVGEVCDYEEDGSPCNNGMIMTFDGDRQINKTCPKCNGSGLMKNPNRQSTVLVSNKVGFNNESVIKPSEAFHFAQPDPSGLAFVDKDIQNHETRARQILHLHQTTSEVKGNDDVTDTATGARIDMDQQYSFIKPIADQTFDIFYDLLEIIEKMRYARPEVSFELFPPITYDFRTKEDLLYEVEQAIKIGEPALINIAVYEYLRHQYYNDEETLEAFKVIRRSDRLFGLGKDQVTGVIARKSAEKWEEVLHFSAFNILNELIRENESFLELETEVQVEQMRAKAQEIAMALQEMEAESTEGMVQRIANSTANPQRTNNQNPTNPNNDTSRDNEAGARYGETAMEKVRKIRAANDVGTVNSIASGDDRVSVINAAQSKIEQLNSQ